MDHILSIVLLTPLAGLLVLLFIPSSNARAIKLWANAISFVGFLVSVPLAVRFDPGKDFQFVERAAWIPTLGASYHIGIDGLGLLLVMLTTLIGFLAVLSSWNAIHERLKEYYAFFLVLQVGMLGVFMALDFLLFFVFWESVLVPMYFIIALWGGQRRGYASIKFMVYTLAGSVLMFLGILYLYSQHLSQFGTPSFDIAELMRTQIPAGAQWWVFWAFFVGFAVKVPMFPFHTWLPDAHTEAPTAGSVILASVLLKMGTYGFLRFSIPLLPDAAKDPKVILIVSLLSIIGIVYGALASLMQKDWKKLVAYSSVSHLGFVVLGIFSFTQNGIFSFTQMGLDGAVYQMLNHGISTGALFVLVGFMYERRHSLEIVDYGGVATVAPWLSTIFLITTLASIGLPTLNNFIGEFLVLQGSAQANILWTVFASLGVILSACYMLWLYQRVFFGKASEEVEHHMPDFTGREWACMVPLIIMMVWMGTYTQTFLTPVTKATARLLEQTTTSAPIRAQISGGGSQHAR